jgi:pyruvate,water dikinase
MTKPDPLPLDEIDDAAVFGGKAASLGAALRAGLPVPTGLGLSTSLVDRIAADENDAISAVLESSHLPTGRMAVRSSAVGEDAAGDSFAGQHATRLNVIARDVASAVRVVWESGRTESALAYRRHRGLDPKPQVAVVIQRLIEPVAAGVLFTCDPITGSDERLIEAAWGFGEVVVSGLVTPDRYRLDNRGRILESVTGQKDVKVWYSSDEEGTAETPVPPELHEVACLTTDHLEQLNRLADRCIAVWGPERDLEWALGADGAIYLLQSRPITTLARKSQAQPPYTGGQSSR